MVEARRSSKRRRTSGETQKFHEERKEEEEEQQQSAKDDTRKPLTAGLSDNVGRNKSPVIVFAHGAGAPSSSDWMISWKKMLHESLNAVEVVTFDYPYFAGGKKKAPPKAEKLVDFHADIVKKTMEKYPDHPLILAGKSMGSRISCMVAAASDIDVFAIVCLGYPLKGMNGALRDETLLLLRVPVMFVQGNKDGLCPLDKLNAVRKKMNAVSELHVVEGGDHSFKVAKKHLQQSGTTQDEAEHCAVQAIATFVDSLSEAK
ncbi:OLC1v1029999C1 [Oldenlandia corymbosa var. corymbosa]|uniref:OLC1v1029999C1 n=1 Tax=Oldenlandia corymbosa var. corymbosa TaxID=529605 RepID=A0AAV1CIA3_OLDCO|nr:OLC1v1029999C1 [Oldenlandia corymbosa var. corymbosa]